MRKDMKVIYYFILSFFLVTTIINFEGTFIPNVNGQSEEEDEEDNSIVILN